MGDGFLLGLLLNRVVLVRAVSSRRSPLRPITFGVAAFADPETDLERPLAVALRFLATLEFESTDQAGRARELVEGEQAEGVAHHDADAGALSSPSPVLRRRRITIANAARPRYASVLPPPVGKKRRSTVSRLGSVGSTMPGRFSSTKASWNAFHCGLSILRRWHSALPTARLATRKASRTSGSIAKRLDTTLDPFGGEAGQS